MSNRLKKTQHACAFSHLVMHEHAHDVVIYFRGDSSFWLVGNQDILNSQERHQDEGGSHSFHVQAGFCLMSHLQLSDEHPHDVQQEKQIDLGDVNELAYFVQTPFVNWLLNVAFVTE